VNLTEGIGLGTGLATFGMTVATFWMARSTTKAAESTARAVQIEQQGLVQGQDALMPMLELAVRIEDITEPVANGSTRPLRVLKRATSLLVSYYITLCAN
jgi:hypothetical protein